MSLCDLYQTRYFLGIACRLLQFCAQDLDAYRLGLTAAETVSRIVLKLHLLNVRKYFSFQQVVRRAQDHFCLRRGKSPFCLVCAYVVFLVQGMKVSLLFFCDCIP